MSQDVPHRPGRLGNPSMLLMDDPRADPRMLAAVAPDEGQAPPELPPAPTAATPIQDLHDWVDNGMEDSAAALINGLLLKTSSGTNGELPPITGVSHSVETITGVDGNKIDLSIHTPTNNASGPLPCVLHIHGGAMVFGDTQWPVFVRWRDELASAGLVVVGVQFRNAAGKLGRFPFPAGLNDCSSALQWVAANKQKLRVSKVVLSGESGGGNLSLALALKAKRDGNINQIAGVYALCPYIAGSKTLNPALPSMYENDTYLVECSSMGALAKLYDPEGENATNPLAWPYHASPDDLRGLPPHVVSVNQLDPLRDEGLAYWRKLVGAGVSALGREVVGTCHGADCTFRLALPDVYNATIRDIKSFAESL